MFEILEKLEHTSSSLVKRQILSSSPEELKFYFKYALDTYTQFYIRPHQDLLKVKFQNTIADDEFYVKLIKTMSMIASDEYKGRNAKLEAFENTYCQGSKLARKWSIRLLERRPRCGVNWKIVNDTWPNLLKGFGVRLCCQYKGEDLDWKDWWLEPKLDGRRAVAIVKETEDGQFAVQMLSRNGKDVRGSVEIAIDIEKNSRIDLPCSAWVLDGELYIHNKRSTEDAWAHTSSEASSFGPSPNLRYFAFDWIPLQHWTVGSTDIPYELRKTYLRKAVANMKLTESISPEKIESKVDMEKRCKNLLSQGFEGIILKKAKSGYDFSRSVDWLKVKNVRTWDVKLVNVLEGTGRMSGTCGALTVIDKHTTCKVGSGLSDKDRDMFWTHKDILEGRMMEIAADGRHPSGAFRDPRFLKMRPDLDDC